MTSSVLPRFAYLAATFVITALPRRPPRAGGAGWRRSQSGLRGEPCGPDRTAWAEGPGARLSPRVPSSPTPFTFLLTAAWILSSPQTLPKAPQAQPPSAWETSGRNHQQRTLSLPGPSSSPRLWDAGHLGSCPGPPLLLCPTHPLKALMWWPRPSLLLPSMPV